jgi:hypothetical protein
VHKWLELILVAGCQDEATQRISEDQKQERQGVGSDAEHEDGSNRWSGRRELMSSNGIRAPARSMASRDTSGDTIHPAEGYTIDR